MIERLPPFVEQEASRLITPALRELKTLGALDVFPVPIEDIIQDEFPLEVVKADNLTFADVQRYAQRAQIAVQEQNPDTALAGYLLAGSNRGAVFINRDPSHGDGNGRQRHSAAHELGHYMLEARALLAGRDNEFVSIACSLEDMSLRAISQAGIAEERYRHWQSEVLANQFAAEVLMPYDDVRNFIGARQPSLQSVDEMSDRYATSFTSCLFRYVGVSDEDCAIVISKNGVRQRFMLSQGLGAYRGRFTLRRQQQIGTGTAAHLLHTGQAPSRNMSGNYFASSWFPFCGNNRLRVREFSRLLTGIGVVVSLLWFEGGVEEQLA